MNDKENVEITYFPNDTVIESKEHFNEIGKLHNTNGPAVTFYYYSGNIEAEYWFVNGKYHRTDGPARMYYSEDGYLESEFWYLNGKEIEPQKWLEENGYEWPLTNEQQADLVKRFSENHELDFLGHPLYQDLRNYFLRNYF